MLAARCRQEGHDEDAAELEQSASELEARFRGRLQSFLDKHSLADLPDAEFSDELTAATAERLAAAWRRLRDELLAAAVVADVEGDVAYLRGTSPRGLPIEVDLPRVLLTRQSLEPGDAVWVFRRPLGDAVLIELLPATRVQLPCPDRVNSELAGLTVDAIWHGEPAGVADDGLTDAERAGYASHYQETAAADLTADQAAQLKRAVAAGRVPRRPLRPAG